MDINNNIQDNIQDNIDENMQEAINDFTKRIMVTELPDNMNPKPTKYVKSIMGIECILGLINHETNNIILLPDDFDAPFDEISLWLMAIKNCMTISAIDTEHMDIEKNIYPINTYCGRGVICCEEFWKSICDKYNVLRLIIHLYKQEDKSYIMTSLLKDDSDIDVKAYIHMANEEDEYRTTYVYIKNVGVLSEAALNSKF